MRKPWWALVGLAVGFLVGQIYGAWQMLYADLDEYHAIRMELVEVPGEDTRREGRP